LNLDKILLGARWAGVILLVLSWVQITPLTIGWIGFGIAGISFILETIFKKNLARPGIDNNPEK